MDNDEFVCKACGASAVAEDGVCLVCGADQSEEYEDEDDDSLYDDEYEES
jgi:predicted ATP-dependent serine protease